LSIHKNIPCYFIIFISIFLLFFDFLNNATSMYPYWDDDVYLHYDYRANTDLSGWRFDKGIGTSFLIGDTSFHAWSLPSLIHNLLGINSFLLHNIFLVVLIFICVVSFYHLLKVINKKLDKIYLFFFSVLLIQNSFIYEFYFQFSWLLTICGVCNCTLILIKYFNNQKYNYYIYYFSNLFFIFHFGSIIAVQNTLLFSLIFSIIYSYYYKINIFINYIKISLISLLLLLFLSFWVLYPSFVELGKDQWTRVSNYNSLNIWELNFKGLYDYAFNLFFGPLFNENVKLIGQRFIPSSIWISSIPLAFNLIFLHIIFQFKQKTFEIYFCKVIVICFLIHFLISEFVPFYGSLNTLLINIYPWTHVHLILYVFQLFLMSFLFTEKSIRINKYIKYYGYILVIFLFLIIFFIFLIQENFFLEFLMVIIGNINLFLNLIDENILNLILDENINRLKLILNNNYFKIYLVFTLFSIIIVLYKEKLNLRYLLIIIMVISNIAKTNYHNPIHNNLTYFWNEINLDNANQNYRIAYLSDKYFLDYHFSKKNKHTQFDEKYINDWIKYHQLNKESDKYYGIRAPSSDSFSDTASFVPTDLKNSLKPFEIRNLQEGFLNQIFLNNLSIKYLYTKSSNDKIINDNNFNLNNIFTNDRVIIFENKSHLPYFYLASKIYEIDNDFLNTYIEKKTAYLKKDDFNILKNKNFQEGKIKLISRKNSKFVFEYDSNYDGFLVISDAFDSNWKAKSNKRNFQIFKTNYFFKGIKLEAGKYQIEIFYDVSKYYLGVYVSIISLFVFISLILYLRSNKKYL
jgi:hypothetical protein